MLKRIYVDNYKSLVNFELKFEDINLILGKNGSGKSVVFEVLRNLQDFILGDFSNESKYYQVSEIFKQNDRTRWQTTSIQRFELDIEGNEGLYQYSLEIEHPINKFNFQQSRMRSEKLSFNTQTLFEFWIKEDSDSPNGQAQIYNDNPERQGAFLEFFDWSRSGVGFVYERAENQKLIWFKKRIANIFIVYINPFSIESENFQEATRPNFDVSNYSAWYSYLSQENQSQIIKLTLELQKIIEGFESFQNKKIAEETRSLLVLFSQPQRAIYQMKELSNGIKILIVLYTLIYCTPDENCTLCIDEPENFLALPEIQPWLSELIDYCADNPKQTILISHHPSLINYLASSSAYWFERQDNAGTRIKKIHQENDNNGISLAKLIELGWIYDE
ncbi:MAG: ATP-binding protein [Cyanobacteria bacterium P01_E01_bin.42]